MVNVKDPIRDVRGCSNNPGAAGDGKADDTAAIQCAIAFAERQSIGGIPGARIYIPAGVYKIGGTAAEPQHLYLRGSNLTLYGDGDASVLYIPDWRDDGNAASQGYVMILNEKADVENVRIENLRLLGNRNAASGFKHWTRHAFSVGYAPNGAVVVRNSGFSRVRVEGSGGAAFYFTGGDATHLLSNNYVTNCIVTKSAYEGIDANTDNLTDVILSGNIFADLGFVGIEWAGQGSVITGNVFSNLASSALSVTHGGSDCRTAGSIIFADNVITSVGNNRGVGDTTAAVQIGQVGPTCRVTITSNLIRDAYGDGVSLGAATQDITISNNDIEFGRAGDDRGPVGRRKGINTQAMKTTRIRVTGNTVRCSPASPTGCGYGIVTGHPTSTDTWTDGNVALGAFSVKPFIQVGAFVGTNNRVGKNMILNTGVVPGYFTDSHAESIPALQPDNPTPSVGGSDVWRVAQTKDLQITNLVDGSVGRLLTLIFQGNHRTKIMSNRTFLLKESFCSTPGRLQTLTLLRQPDSWVEVSRVGGDSKACP